MKRLHLSVTVTDLEAARQFYGAMFAAEPTVVREDYLKWRLDEPAVNLAVELGDAPKGVTHLGIDADTPEELEETVSSMNAANIPHTGLEQGTCCYAESEKTWAADPAGLPWEAFHTTAITEEFGTPFIGKAEEEPAPVMAACGCC